MWDHPARALRKVVVPVTAYRSKKVAEGQEGGAYHVGGRDGDGGKGATEDRGAQHTQWLLRETQSPSRQTVGSHQASFSLLYTAILRNVRPDHEFTETLRICRPRARALASGWCEDQPYGVSRSRPRCESWAWFRTKLSTAMHRSNADVAVVGMPPSVIRCKMEPHGAHGAETRAQRKPATLRSQLATVGRGADKRTSWGPRNPQSPAVSPNSGRPHDFARKGVRELSNVMGAGTKTPHQRRADDTPHLVLPQNCKDSASPQKKM